MTLVDDLLAELDLGRVPVDVVGPTHVLPSPFAVTELASATVAGATAAAAQLAAIRNDDHVGRVLVDRRHAAVAFRSERHLRVGGEAPTLWDPISGYHRARDGRWVQLHANFPHHRAGIVEYLGVDAQREAVSAAIADRDAFELEDALTARGLICAALRSLDEWSGHPHAAAHRGEPVVAIERIGDAPPGAPSPADRPLADIRVLDLTRVIAGPVATRTLAAHGADVLRITSPHRPVVAAAEPDTAWGKRSAHLDLELPGDRARLDRLVADADVFVQSYRPGSLAARGYGADRLARLRPGIVHVSVSAFGTGGPWGGRRGFDSICQTATGIAHEGARYRPGDDPRPLPCQALDHATGFLAAAGATAALVRRATEGGSWAVSVSLQRTRDLLVSLGIDHAAERGVVAPTHDDVADLLDTRSTPFGPVTHVRPPGSIDGVAPRWERPPSPAGSDRPTW
ncbi:MAG: CoA transferase [Actinomycetota bacterium]